MIKCIFFDKNGDFFDKYKAGFKPFFEELPGILGGLNKEYLEPKLFYYKNQIYGNYIYMEE